MNSMYIWSPVDGWRRHVGLSGVHEKVHLALFFLLKLSYSNYIHLDKKDDWIGEVFSTLLCLGIHSSKQSRMPTNNPTQPEFTSQRGWFYCWCTNTRPFKWVPTDILRARNHDRKSPETLQICILWWRAVVKNPPHLSQCVGNPVGWTGERWRVGETEKHHVPLFKLCVERENNLIAAALHRRRYLPVSSRSKCLSLYSG